MIYTHLMMPFSPGNRQRMIHKVNLGKRRGRGQLLAEIRYLKKTLTFNMLRNVFSSPKRYQPLSPQQIELVNVGNRRLTAGNILTPMDFPFHGGRIKLTYTQQGPMERRRQTLRYKGYILSIFYPT